MDYREHIIKAIDYIEENLNSDIDNASLAKIAGYSEYHFLRVFRDTVNLTPADYIRKRRITEIICRMVQEDRFISELAFEYGFNSKENFVRAFKREHRILPTDFRRIKNSLKLYPRMTFETTPFEIEDTLMFMPPMTLTVYKSDEDTPPHFWNKYNVHGLSKKLSGGKNVTDYGACIWNYDACKLDYYIGIRSEEAVGDITGTINIDIPGGLYAVFDTPPSSLTDFVNTIHRSWDYIGKVWLRENDFRRTGGYELERYTEESRIFSERIFIPVTKNTDK